MFDCFISATSLRRRSGHLSDKDPIKVLYPYADELWPSKVPEHIRFQQDALKLRRRKRQEWLRKMFRICGTYPRRWPACSVWLIGTLRRRRNADQPEPQFEVSESNRLP